MTTPQISPLPPMPARTDAPVDFSAKADAALAALQPFADQANALALDANAKATAAASSAASVAGVQTAVNNDRVLSQQAAQNAAGSAAAAGVSATSAQNSATAAGLSATASEASAVRAEDAAQYVESITDGAAPLNSPNFTGTVKVNDVPLGAAAFKNVGTVAGDVMEVGAFGLGAALGLEGTSSLVIDANEINTTRIVFCRSSGANIPNGGSGWHVIHLQNAAPDYANQIAVSSDTRTSMYYRLKNANIWGPWIETLNTDNIQQSTGQSTQFPMSQKAVTDAIANIPSVPKSVAYTVTAADKGASIDTTTSVTIPASVFAVGDVIVVTNTSATNSTITPAAGVTIRLAGTASTGARTLAGYGVATFRMVSNNVWFASGAGLT